MYLPTCRYAPPVPPSEQGLRMQVACMPTSGGLNRRLYYHQPARERGLHISTAISSCRPLAFFLPPARRRTKAAYGVGERRRGGPEEAVSPWPPLCGVYPDGWQILRHDAMVLLHGAEARLRDYTWAQLCRRSYHSLHSLRQVPCERARVPYFILTTSRACL